MTAPQRRLFVGTKALSAPPAVWMAFVRQGAWKSWVIIFQLFLIALLVLANMRHAQRTPDVVLVAPDGKSTYVTASIASEALLRFLSEQKQQPSDATVLHFTSEFLTLALAVNSSTIDAAWPKAMAMMSPSLRARIAKETAEQKLLQTYKLAQVRTELIVREVVIVERAEPLLHVRATISRRKSNLMDGTNPSQDELRADLIERIIPRTVDRPDGLELADFHVRAISGSTRGAAGAERLPEAGHAP